ncbi:MAG: nickel pincer cofactor biosynthesis protein LarC [Anaerolineae bacterium]
MKTAYFDCIAGASGDMILGALVDAGLPVSELYRRLEALHLNDFELHAHQVAKNAFAATKIDVIVRVNVPERHLGDILAIVERSDLAGELKEKAVAIFRKIGAAEAAIHGTTLEEVHLHELGGVDTIVDVVGALVGLDALGIERVVVSPIPLGRGFIHGAHGQIPLPAPATVSLLKGVPVVGSPLQAETVTPTGAALLATLGDEFGPIPAMALEAVGYGAGSRDLPVPNVLRLLIGESEDIAPSHHHHDHDDHDHPHPHTHEHSHKHEHAHDHNVAHDHADEHTHTHHQGHTHEHEDPDHGHAHVAGGVEHEHPHSHTDSYSCMDTEKLSVLETNIDDLNPEVYEHVMTMLFEKGALDVFLAPIQMKKNRPATLLRVLCRPEDVGSMTDVLFRETSTLGIREQTVDRHALPRTVESVDTRYGKVHVKIATLGDGSVKIAPEYEDCRHLAQHRNVPLREVYQAAEEAARRAFGG